MLGLTVGCATLPGTGGLDGGADATYKVENRPGGFLISSTYISHQQVTERDARSSCKRSIIATAHDYADSFGRKIEPVNEERVRISMGRSAIPGMSTCEASVPVVWAR